MMVHCGKCGAELLGAVNRCWKCGQAVVSRSDAASVPPVRRPPVAGPLLVAPWEALTPAIVDAAPPSAAEPLAAGATGVAVSPDVREGEPTASPTVVRRGSPFAPGAALHQSPARVPSAVVRRSAATSRDLTQPLEVERPRSALELWLPIVAICLGAGAFGLGDYPEISLSFAILGTAFGAVAIAYRVKVTSVAGIVICVLALLWSGYSTAVSIYERTYGVSPWVSPDDDFEPTPLDNPAP